MGIDLDDGGYTKFVGQKAEFCEAVAALINDHAWLARNKCWQEGFDHFMKLSNPEDIKYDHCPYHTKEKSTVEANWWWNGVEYADKVRKRLSDGLQDIF